MRYQSYSWLRLWVLVLGLVLCLGTAQSALAFDLQAHRGGRGLWPENTLAAFQRAIGLGVTTLEMDAAVTADGVVVISHDAALNPAFTRDASGQWLNGRGPLIHELTLEQVQQYDVGRLNPDHGYGREFTTQTPMDGQHIPTLESVFALVRKLGADQVHFDIETKINPHYPQSTLPPEPFVQALLAVIRKNGMTQRVMVQSFDWRTLELLHKLEPGLRTMYLTTEGGDFDTLKDGSWNAGRRLADYDGSIPRMVRASAGASTGVIWAPRYPNLTQERLAEAHRLGLLVVPWTVNQPDAMRKLMDWGVDGIISDYPDRLRDVMRQRGLALPQPPAR